MPTVNFLTAFGIGVTGLYSTIRSNAVTNDDSGDTYITGSFRGTASFDPNSSASTFTTNNTQDTFVAEYSPTSTLDWVKTFSGTSTSAGGQTTYAVSQGSAIAVDGSGNVFVTGGFSGTVNLPGASHPTSISSPGATEVYLAKLNPVGNLVWVDTVAGTPSDTDQAYALALDSSGGAVIAGSFADSATFGSTTLTAGGASAAFVSHVNSAGTFLWSVASQGTAGSNAQINGVAVDSSGNVSLAGFFSGTVDFNPSSGVTSLVAAGSDDALVWRLNSSGGFLWANDYGSPDYDVATAVAVDSSGNTYVTGSFSDTLNFGTLAQPSTLTAGPIFDTFVLKVDPNGNEVWVKGLVGPGGWSKGQGIQVDASGIVHVVGTFNGEVDFDPNGGFDNLTSVGSNDVFVTALDPTGRLIYALQAGQTNFNAALGVSVNSAGTVALSGTYSGSINFGTIAVPAIGLGSIFVATIAPQAPLPPSPSAPVLEASSDTGYSQSDDITADTTPVFDVNTAVAGETVDLFRAGVLVAQRTGPGALMDPGPITNGTYAYWATQLNLSGVSSLASPTLSVTFLTTHPRRSLLPRFFRATIQASWAMTSPMWFSPVCPSTPLRAKRSRSSMARALSSARSSRVRPALT